MKAAPVFALAAALALSGCASTNPSDPLETYNRAAFGFNDALDRVALKPAAEAYQTLPDFMRQGVYNFFSNLEDVGNGLNNVLQGKFRAGASDFGRFALNTTFGVGGLFDLATGAGLDKHYEDFGQTLAYWGVESGPYVVLPFFGPSTLRDAAVKPVDFKTDPWLYVKPVRTRNIGTVVRVIDGRAALLDASNLLEDAALDRYQFVRDAYLQRRRSQVYDGDPPPAEQ